MAKTKNNKGFRLIVSSLACICYFSIAKADFLRAGREAFMNYDFELAKENFEKYAISLKKNPNAEGEELLKKYMLQLEIAENSLDNVQKIEIINRIDVPASDYIKYIKLPDSGGKLLDPDASFLNHRQNESDYAYSSETGDVLIWSENEEGQKEVLMQSEKLMDGTWELPHEIGTDLIEGGNMRNPFLLTDGLTLYFSGDGEESMGGYDLFVATKDPISGEYRQPIGLGFPFNSPFNEYMLAIDEDNGIGWWVTDRNRLEGQLTIYIFKTNDVRKNYNRDEEEEIISLARIDDIGVTQNPSTDYARILKEIDSRHRQVENSTGSEFIFPMQGGRVARRLSDFTSSNAKRNMQQYLLALEEHKALEKKLSDLRKKYHQTDKKKGSATSLKNQILDIEKQMEWQSDRLKKMRNTIISAEIKN